MTAASHPPGGRLFGLLGCRILGAVTLALVSVAAFTPAVEWLAARYAEPARVAPADAIVVLGGNFKPDGWLDTPSWRRLIHGIALHRQGLAPLLVLSGGTPRVGPSEPEVRARRARELGVPPAEILPVIGANTTHEEALRVGAALRARGARSLLLVSDPIHLVRARAAFAREGLDIRPAPTDDPRLHGLTPGERLALARTVVREVVGRLYYRLAGYA